MIVSARRYYLLKAKALAATSDGEDLATVYWGKWQAETHTSLPADFPARAKLIAASYVGLEDVDGASPNELQRLGLSSREADAVRDALDALL